MTKNASVAPFAITAKKELEVWRKIIRVLRLWRASVSYQTSGGRGPFFPVCKMGVQSELILT
jgi:hypothetical protein